MKKLLIITSILLTLTACDKFVDVVPKGKTIPSTVDDLAKLMNNPFYDVVNKQSDVIVSIGTFDVMTDDEYLIDTPGMFFSLLSVPEFHKNMYLWQPYIYNLSEDDPTWSKLYKSNYILNYILEEIDNVKDGFTYNRNDIKGRALVHRAMNYFLLANVYGKQYSSSTAATDLAVPLLLKSNINESQPRATVDQVYKQITTDLELSLTLLNRDVDTYGHIPAKVTAFALLARVYLFMGNYEKAFLNANEALKLKSTLIDYNTLSLEMPSYGPFAGVKGYRFNAGSNPEEIYFRGNNSGGFASPDLLSKFDKTSDLRYRYMIGNLAYYGVMDMMSWSSPNGTSLVTSEVWLTKAEAALRKATPDVAAAIAALDYVRQRRLDSKYYAPTTATNVTQLLDMVLDERRRELRMSPMRWFDLKRLNLEPSRAKTITRTAQGKTYTLEPNSPLYVLPIPLNVMQFNKAYIQNPAPGRN